MHIDKDEITSMTMEYGGDWGINHTRRLLNLIAIIGKDLKYDTDMIWVAAHLHDWGAYPKWVQANVDHAIRSAQVAEAFLTERGYPEDSIQAIVECIQQHHTSGANRSIESVLLYEADALDFLGVVGILRDFSKSPKDLRKAYETTLKRKEKLPGTLTLSKSREIAEKRICDMTEILFKFEADSFGWF